jgi:predicted transcriptional regulator
MELGSLELAVLKAVRTLGEATPGDIHRAVQAERDVAYTSVTTTIYRLVEKGLLAVRRESEKRMFYRVRGGSAYRKTVGGLMDRLLDAFGPAAIDHLLERTEALSDEEREALRAAIEAQRRKEGHVDR